VNAPPAVARLTFTIACLKGSHLEGSSSLSRHAKHAFRRTKHRFAYNSARFHLTRPTLTFTPSYHTQLRVHAEALNTGIRGSLTSRTGASRCTEPRRVALTARLRVTGTCARTFRHYPPCATTTPSAHHKWRITWTSAHSSPSAFYLSCIISDVRPLWQLPHMTGMYTQNTEPASAVQCSLVCR